MMKMTVYVLTTSGNFEPLDPDIYNLTLYERQLMELSEEYGVDIYMDLNGDYVIVDAVNTTVLKFCELLEAIKSVAGEDLRIEYHLDEGEPYVKVGW